MTGSTATHFSNGWHHDRTTYPGHAQTCPSDTTGQTDTPLRGGVCLSGCPSGIAAINGWYNGVLKSVEARGSAQGWEPCLVTPRAWRNTNSRGFEPTTRQLAEAGKLRGAAGEKANQELAALFKQSVNLAV